MTQPSATKNAANINTRCFPITSTVRVFIRLIDLDMNGVLTIKKNYAGDGASGPILDTQE